MVTAKSIRQQVYEKWVENPYLKPKKVCQELHLKYKKHGNYVRKLLSQYRCYHKFVRGEKPVLPSRRTFQWDCIFFDEEKGLSHGWIKSKGPDGRLIFYGDHGSVHWYKSGLVLLYLRGPLMLARAKELFCKSFSWMSGKEISEYVDVPLREVYKKWVFELGAPVPRFDIRKFERSHGIRIFADGSHPTSIHVGESTPFWIGQITESIVEFGSLHEKFGENLKEHMVLIKEWQKEARTRRRKKGLFRRFIEWLF